MKNRINKVRSRLLLIVDQENNNYIKYCDVKLNSKLPKQIIKDYDTQFMITFDNPLITQSNKDNNCSNSVKNVASANYFQRCIKVIGKEFIDYIKLEVGKQKLDSQHGSYVNTKPLIKKKKSIEIDTELSFIETVAQIKSSSCRKRNKVFTFPNYAKCSIEEILTDKEEKEAEVIQRNFDKLQEISKRLKKGDNYNHDEEYANLEKYANFHKFNDELFERLHSKGITFNEKAISKKEEIDLKDNCVHELKKKKSDVISNPRSKFFDFSNEKSGKSCPKYKTTGSFYPVFTNDEYDTKESTKFVSPNGKIQTRMKNEIEMHTHEEEYYSSSKELSPIEKWSRKKKSKFFLKNSSIEESFRNSLCLDQPNHNDLNLLTLIKCKKSPILRKDSENSKYSEISKFTKSPNTLSVISCSSVSEVSSFYEMNCCQNVL